VHNNVATIVKMSDPQTEDTSHILVSDSSARDVETLIQQVEEDDQSRLRSLWNLNMENVIKPVRYCKTIVLLLSFVETDLETKPEVVTKVH
jgi:hypothetical protein